MRSLLPTALFLGALPVLLQANYLTNSDFKSDLSGWLSGGEIAYLKDDGTEGS